MRTTGGPIPEEGMTITGEITVLTVTTITGDLNPGTGTAGTAMPAVTGIQGITITGDLNPGTGTAGTVMPAVTGIPGTTITGDLNPGTGTAETAMQEITGTRGTITGTLPGVMVLLTAVHRLPVRITGDIHRKEHRIPEDKMIPEEEMRVRCPVRLLRVSGPMETGLLAGGIITLQQIPEELPGKDREPIHPETTTPITVTREIPTGETSEPNPGTAITAGETTEISAGETGMDIPGKKDKQ